MPLPNNRLSLIFGSCQSRSPVLPQLKSVKIPQRRNKVSPKKRDVVPSDDGPGIYQIIRRAEVLGETVVVDSITKRPRVSGNAPHGASDSPVELLFNKGKITHAQLKAALLYGQLRQLLFGKSVAKQSTLSSVLSEGHGEARHEYTLDEIDEHWEEIRLAYYRGDNRLRKLERARRVREMVRRVVIDRYMPTADRPNHLLRLREGLQELSDCWDCDK